jgi:hypothetical protein
MTNISQPLLERSGHPQMGGTLRTKRMFSRRMGLLPAGTPSSYLFSDNLDYADAAAAAAAGWADVSTPVWHNTTPPAPLGGYASSFACNSSDDNSIHTFTAAAHIYAYVMFNTATSDYPMCLWLLDAAGADVAGMAISGTSPNGTARITNSTGTSTNTDTLATATTYHCWLDYDSATGDVTGIWSIDGTKAGGASHTWTRTGNGAANQAAKVRLMTGTGAGVAVWNKLRVSAAVIGDNPA